MVTLPMFALFKWIGCLATRSCNMCEMCLGQTELVVFLIKRKTSRILK